MSEPAALRIAFLHPDLGLGGAERLVVDAALCLQRSGHHVTIHTCHHDESRCFDATRDGTLDVRVHGRLIPHHIGQRLRAPLAIVRMAWAGWSMWRRFEPYDVVFCDVTSHVIPLLRLLMPSRLVFYCHFPDKLLAPDRRWWSRPYRWGIDQLEEWGLRRAHVIAVNSRYTLDVVRRTFPSLAGRSIEVLYPGVDVELYRQIPPLSSEELRSAVTFLTLNRFEPRKGVLLALDAFVGLRERLGSSDFRRLRLVLAGGYDGRLAESRRTLDAVRRRIRDHALSDHVELHLSPSESERLDLLRRCAGVVHPIDGEHFGFVPIEAMASGRPVIAVRRGGPVETIEDGVTGLLCAPASGELSAAMAMLARDPELARRLGEAARAQMHEQFSLDAFARDLTRIITG